MPLSPCNMVSSNHEEPFPPSWVSSLGTETKDWIVCPTFWLVWGLPKGLVSVLPDLEHRQIGNGVCRPLKREVSSTLKLHFYSRQQVEQEIRKGFRGLRTSGWADSWRPCLHEAIMSLLGEVVVFSNFILKLQGIKRNKKTWPNHRNKIKPHIQTL